MPPALCATSVEEQPALANYQAQVCGGPKCKWSPQQISLHLDRTFSEDGTQRVSFECIYNAIYAQPRGE